MDAEFFQLTTLLPCSIMMPDIDHLDPEDLEHLLSTTEPPRDLSRICLTYADLGHKKMKKTDFGEAVIIGVNFKHADLTESNLSRTSILFTNLDGVDLRQANLDGGTRFASRSMKGVSPTLTLIRMVGLSPAA